MEKLTGMFLILAIVVIICTLMVGENPGTWQDEVTRLDDRINQLAMMPDIYIEKATVFRGEAEIIIEDLEE